MRRALETPQRYVSNLQEAVDNLQAALDATIKALGGDDLLLADILRRFLSDYEYDGWGGGYWDVSGSTMCLDKTVELTPDEMDAVRRWLDR